MAKLRNGSKEDSNQGSLNRAPHMDVYKLPILDKRTHFFSPRPLLSSYVAQSNRVTQILTHALNKVDAKFHEETCLIESRFQSGRHTVEKMLAQAFKQRACPSCSSRVIYLVRPLQRSGQ